MHPKQYLNRKQEAQRTKVSERTLERHCKEGYPYIRLGNRILFDPDLSDEYLAARVQHGRAAELSRQAA